MIALLVTLICLVFTNDVYALFHEGGPVEGMSAVFWFIAALWLTVHFVRSGQWRIWHTAFLLWAAGMRELDWDKAFTQEGVLQLRLYSGDAPLVQKAIGAAIVLLILVAVMRLLIRDLPGFLRRLRLLRANEWLMVLVVSLLFVAKTIDGLGRKLAPFGIEVTEWASGFAGRAEESMELFAAILILQVVALYAGREAPQETRREARASPGRQDGFHQLASPQRSG